MSEKIYVIINIENNKFLYIQRTLSEHLCGDVGRIYFTNEIINASMFSNKDEAQNELVKILEQDCFIDCNTIDSIIEGKENLINKIKDNLRIKEVELIIK